MKHTPKPWYVEDGAGIGHLMTTIKDADGEWICNVSINTRSIMKAELTAEHIVKCVNEHDALVAENERLRDALEIYADKGNWRSEEFSEIGEQYIWLGTLESDVGYELAKQALESEV